MDVVSFLTFNLYAMRVFATVIIQISVKDRRVIWNKKNIKEMNIYSFTQFVLQLYYNLRRSVLQLYTICITIYYLYLETPEMVHLLPAHDYTSDGPHKSVLFL